MLRQEMFGPVGAPKYRECADAIFASGTTLLNLVNRVIEFARLGTGRVEASEEADPAEIAAAALARLGEPRRARIDDRVAGGLPRLAGDRHLLAMALAELLDNAVKFGGGRPVLGAEVTPEGGLAFLIEDDGPGMSTHDVVRAFRPFAQLESSFNRRAEGLGIGLPMAQRIAEAHQGTLEINTAPGAGARVRLVLPPGRLVIAIDEAVALGPRLPDEQFRDLLDLWRARGGGAGAAVLGARELPHLMPHVFIADADRRTGGFRFRVIGAAVAEHCTARRGGERGGLEAAIRTVAAERRPVFREFRRGGQRHGRLLLPIVAGGGRVRAVLGMIRRLPAGR
jgi:hypothetical protein